MSLMDRLKSATKIKGVDVLSESTIAKRTVVDTKVPALNIVLSGQLNGGMYTGVNVFCGESKTFKCVDGDTPLVVYTKHEDHYRPVNTTYKLFYQMVQQDSQTNYYVQGVINNKIQYRKIDAVAQKVSNTVLIKFDNGYQVRASTQHAFMDPHGYPVIVQDLRLGYQVQTLQGLTAVQYIGDLIENQPVYDISIAYPHWYINQDNAVIHHNTCLALVCAKAYLDKFDDSILIFYDSEMGASPDYFESFGIDPERVIHVPITDVEVLKFDLVQKLQEINRGDHVVIVVDSLGNLASKKEIQDAIDEKSVADMTRAKSIKSFFRIVTPMINFKDIPLVCIAHTYKDTNSFIPRDVLSGGCLLPGTKIQMADGTLKNVEDIQTGEYVKTLEGDQLVTHTWNPDTLENGCPVCYQVTLSNGFVVQCSDKHKFLVNNKWIRAKDLQPNDVVRNINGNVNVVSVENIGRHQVYDIAVNNVEHYLLEDGTVTHNSGILYSADTVIGLTKSQNKQGTELVGFNFNMKVIKSRHSREASKVPLTVNFNGGVNVWSGLLEMALASGHVIKPSNGWYQRVDISTGRVIGNKVREKDTNNRRFWEPVLQNSEFQQWVKSNFSITHGRLVEDQTSEFVPNPEFTAQDE